MVWGHTVTGSCPCLGAQQQKTVSFTRRGRGLGASFSLEFPSPPQPPSCQDHVFTHTPTPGPVPAPFSADPFSGGPLFLESLSGTSPPCLATEEIERTLQPERDFQNDEEGGPMTGWPGRGCRPGVHGHLRGSPAQGPLPWGSPAPQEGKGSSGAATCSGEGWLAAPKQDSASHAQRPGSPAALAPGFAELPGEGLSVTPAPITARGHPQLAFISLGAPAHPSVRGPLHEST